MRRTKYRAPWRKIFFVAVIFHAAIIFTLEFFWLMKAPEIPVELEEIEWVEEKNFSEGGDLETNDNEEIFPTIEMPKVSEQTFSEPEPPKPPENKIQPTEEKKSAEVSEKKFSEENSQEKINVVMKVYPKDVAEQLISAGIINERPRLPSGKVILSVTVGLDGKMRAVEILSGGDGSIINIVSEAAASAWIFAPYTDSDGNPKEIKTQIEFEPKDF